MNQSRHGLLQALAGVIAVGLTATACGGGTSATSGGDDAPVISAKALASAKRALKPYVGQPSPFPVSEPLAKRPKSGTKFAFLQCGTPICALMAKTAKTAAAELGVTLTVTKAGGLSAQALQQGMDSIINQKPDAVLVLGADPVQYREQMLRLKDLRIPVVSQGIANGEQFGIKAQLLGRVASSRAGQLLADWTVVHNGAKPSVFYSIPELSFTALIATGYTKEMARLCPSCKVRQVKVPIATVGNKAPEHITSDLQAHPETKTAVFAAQQIADGLPVALKSAGITVDTVGFSPPPSVLGYIKRGEITAGLGYDISVSTWMQVDAAARVVTGQPLDPGEKGDRPVQRFLTQKDITFDPARGFAAYPDVARRFAALWEGKSR